MFKSVRESVGVRIVDQGVIPIAPREFLKLKIKHEILKVAFICLGLKGGGVLCNLATLVST